MKSKELFEMRAKLIERYPTGVMRGQKIIDMPEYQIRAIYKNLTEPKEKRPARQIPGQTNMFERM